MSTLRMPKRVISSMLAAVLAITLIPSDVLPEAYAASPEASASASDDAQANASAADAAKDTDASSQSSDAQQTSSASDEQMARPVAVTNSTEPLNANAAKSDKSDVERVRATVSLNSGDAQTLFSFAGLNYAANADGKTATLVGVANTSLEGDITIPSEVVSNGITYAVTNISSTLELRGGGSRLSVIPMA